MAISFVGIGQENGTTSAVTSLSVPIHASTQPGDLVVVGINGAFNGTPPAQSGWTTVLALGSTGAYQAVYCRIFQSGDSLNPTFTGLPSSVASGHSVTYRGVDNVTPQDVAAPATTSGTTAITFPAITPITAGAWIVAIGRVTQISTTTYTVATHNLDQKRSEVLTPGAGTAVDAGGFIADKAWTSGAFTPTATSTAATTRTRGVTMALRPSSGAPAPTNKFFAFL